MNTQVWPNPADTPLDAARHIAREYRHALTVAAPTMCVRLDQAAVARGQGWVAPALVTVRPDDFVRGPQLAELVGVTAGAIRVWAHRGHIRRYTTDGGQVVYRVGDAIDYHAARRRARIARAGS